MKILHVIPYLSLEYGGPVRAVTGLSQTLASLGHAVEIFTTSTESRPDQQTDAYGVTIHRFPRIFPRFYHQSTELEQALKDRIAEFDIVHIHTLWLYPTWISGVWARKKKVPYLIRPCGMLDEYCMSEKRVRKLFYFGMREQATLRGAKAVHFTSRYEQKESRNFVSGTNQVVVPLGIDMERYAHLPALGSFRKHHPEIGTKKIILFAGRLNPIKGLELLIRAFQKPGGKENAHLVLAGPAEGTYGSRLKQLAHELGLQESVTFTGLLNQENLLAAFRDASLFALTSFHESFGLACLEAMAAGLPVLVSDRVGISDEISEANAGIKTACSAPDIQKGLEQLLGDEKKARAFGENGKRLARDQFSWDKAAAAMLNVYSNCLGTAK